MLRSLGRWLSIWAWTYLVWIILTWSKAPEQLSFGAVAAAVVATLLAPPRTGRSAMGPPKSSPVGCLGACRSLRSGEHDRREFLSSCRILSRSRPLRPGMVVVPTEMKTEGELKAVGVLMSLIVDNQIVDLDRKRNELQYHGVRLETGDPAVNRSQINGPLEDLLSDSREPRRSTI